MTTIVCSDDDEVRPKLKLAVDSWAMAWPWKQFTDSNGSAGGPFEYFEPSASTDTCASNTEARDVHVYVRRVPREGGVYWSDKQETPPRKLFMVSGPGVDATYHTNHYSTIALSDKGEVNTSTILHELGHVLGLSDYKTCEELHRTGTALVDPDPTDQHYALMYNAPDRECRPQNQETITDRDYRDLYEAYHVDAITKVRVPWYPVGASKDSRAMNPAINGNVLSFTIHWDDGIAEAAHNASQVAVFGYYTGIGWKLLSQMDLPRTASSLLPMVTISAAMKTPPADPVHNPSPVAAWPTRYKAVGLTSGDIRWEGMRIGQSGKPHTWNFDGAPALASSQTEGDPTFLVARLEQNGQVVSSPPSLSASISPRYCWTGGTLSVSVRAAGGTLNNPKVRLVGAITWRDADGQTEFSVKCDSSDVVQWVGVESDHGTGNITNIPSFVHTPPKVLVLELNTTALTCGSAKDSTVDVPWSVTGLGSASLVYLAVNTRTEGALSSKTGSVGGVKCQEGEGKSGAHIPLAGFALASDGRGATTTTLSHPTVVNVSQTATANGGAFRVTWPRVTGAMGYDLRHSDSSGVPIGSIYVTQPPDGVNPYGLISNLSVGYTYNIHVRVRKVRARTTWSKAKKQIVHALTISTVSTTSNSVSTAVSQVGGSQDGARERDTASATDISFYYDLRLDERVSGTEGTSFIKRLESQSPKNVPRYTHTFANSKKNPEALQAGRTYRVGAMLVVNEVMGERVNAPMLAATFDLSYSVTPSSATLSWGAVSGASGYVVRLGDGAEVPVTQGTSYEFTKLAGGKDYDLSVHAVYEGTKRSAWSSLPATIPVSVPSGVEQTFASTQAMAIRWDEVDGASEYEVQYRSAGGSWESATVEEKRAVLSALTVGTEYQVRVRAKVSGVWSDWSGEITAMTAYDPLPDPTGVVAVETYSTITLKWKEVEGATEYVVMIVDEHGVPVPGQEGEQPSDTKESHEFSDLTPTTRYTVSVRAKATGKASKWVDVPTWTKAVDPIRLIVSAPSAGCVTGGEIRISTYPRGGGTGAYQVTVDGKQPLPGVKEEYVRHQVQCQDTVGEQTFTVVATDAKYPSVSTTETVTVTVKQAPSTKLSVAIRAQRLADDRVEYRLRLKDGTEIRPTSRYITPARMTDGEWDDLESLSATTGGKTYALGQVSVRLDNTVCPSALVFTFLPAQGQRITPSANRFRLDTQAGTWIPSSTFEVTVKSTSDQSSASDQSREDDPQGDGPPDSLMAAAGSEPAQSQSQAVCTAAPSGLDASTFSSTSITLEWDAVSGASQYDVKRTGASEQEVPASDLSFEFDQLEPNTTYTLEVRARSWQGASNWSSVQQTTAAKPVLTLTASASPTTCEAGDEVTVEWMVSGGTGSSTVTVDGTTQSGSSTKVRCQAEAGDQTVTVVATDQGDSSSVTKRLRLTVTKTTPQTLTAKIAARLLSDHRVEFRLRPTDGAELQVATRYITLPKIKAELWYPSGVHTVTIAGTDYTLGVISAWLDNTVCPAQVWVTFIPSGGTRITPSKYKLAVNREVDLWATTSEFEIPLVETPQNASAKGNGNTLERMTVAPEGSSDGPGREGGLMLGDSTALNAQRDQSATTCTDQPTGLATSSVTSNGATLSWSAVSGASEYDVALGQEASEALASTKLTHDFTGLAANTAYTLRVRARSWQGSSEWSSKAVRTKRSSVPVITISAGTSPVDEGDNASFTVTSDRSLTTELNVKLSVTEDGDMISGTAPTQVTIASGSKEATLTVATEDDQQSEPDSVVTATLLSGTGYGLGTASSGTVTVSDDDTQVPALKLNVTSSSTSCETSAQVTIEWTVTGGSGSHTVAVDGEAKTGSSTKVACRDTAGTQTVTVKATDSTNTQLTVTETLSLTVTWPTFTLTTSASPTSCETDGEVTVEWSVGGGSGTSTVTVDGEAKTGSSTKVTCQDTAGKQMVTVKATDAVDRKLTITDRLTLTVTKPPSTVQAKLWARRMSDNRIELELRVEGGTVSSPSKRFANPPQMTDLRWKQSEAMTATIGGRSYNIGRLLAKLQNDRCPSRVEVGLLLTSGTRLLPSQRFIETNSTVDRWRSSAVFEITLLAPSSASADQATAGEAPPASDWLDDTPDNTGAGPGTGGGSMSGDGPSQAPADGAQAGSQSSTTPSCPSLPTSLRTSAITASSITLSWNAVTGATQYDLRRDGVVVGSVQTNTYIFSGLAAGRQHRLEVRARDAWGTSTWIGKAESTLPEPPDDPSNLQVTATTDSLTLSWGAAARATSYQVRINSGQAVRPNLPPLTHKFTGLSADQSYKLEVQAINRGGRSNWVSVTRKTKPTPVMIEASVSPTSCETGGSVTVRWRVSGGSGTYRVTVGGTAQSTSPTTVSCRQTAGTQKIVVQATDTKHTTLSDSEDLSVTVKLPPTVTGQVAARLLSSGKIELAFRPTGKSRITPAARFYTPTTANVNRWTTSGDVYGPAGTESSRLLGKITVKHIKTTTRTYVDVCFLPAGSNLRLCPSSNNFYYLTATVNNWLYTGTVTFKPLQTSASLQADSVQGNTQDDQMQEDTGNEGSATGTEGGLMSDLE